MEEEKGNKEKETKNTNKIIMPIMMMLMKREKSKT